MRDSRGGTLVTYVYRDPVAGRTAPVLVGARGSNQPENDDKRTTPAQRSRPPLCGLLIFRSIGRNEVPEAEDGVYETRRPAKRPASITVVPVCTRSCAQPKHSAWSGISPEAADTLHSASGSDLQASRPDLLSSNPGLKTTPTVTLRSRREKKKVHGSLSQFHRYDPRPLLR